MSKRSGFLASTCPKKLKSLAGLEQEVSAIRLIARCGMAGVLGARGNAPNGGDVLEEVAQPAKGVAAKAIVAAEVKKWRRCIMLAGLSSPCVNFTTEFGFH